MTSSEQSRNGNEQPGFKLPRIVLIGDPASARLDMTVEVPNLDVALNMLAQATRHLEAQFRAQKAQEMQQQMLRAIEDARLAASLSGRR